MELIRGAHNIRPRHRGCVASIGNFDGLHLGHRAVLDLLKRHGQALDLPVLVISFEPLPREFFLGAQAPVRLSRFRDKVLTLQQWAVDRLLCLPFNQRLAQMQALDFIETLLVEALGVRYLVVGDDFHFGRHRQGNLQTLSEAGQRYGFGTQAMPHFDVAGSRASSTRLREALLQGDMHMAQRLLGRPYRLSGRVIHGDKRGRLLGFPTLNLRLGPQRLAAQGVYAVEVHGVAAYPLPGVANLGNRPTVDGLQSRLEVHLLDFSGDLYGRQVHVELLARLRPERHFENQSVLQQQIGHDCLAARRFFADRDGASAPLGLSI